jgi:hypothetical protein
MNRRQVIKWLIAGLGISLFPKLAAAISTTPEWMTEGAIERDAWMDAVIGARRFDAPAVLSKFSDGMYYLRAPTHWTPNQLPSNLSKVTVPDGFVTDLTSIPRPFWSLLPRDGQYADAAIVHDYLYWYQPSSRLAADETLRAAMVDLEVHPAVVEIIFKGVRSSFGESAWKRNERDRRGGESRLLKKYPTDPATRWVDWKKVPGNLVLEG